VTAASQRAALVVGGSRGIGLAVARILGSEGYGLTLAARHQPALDQAVDGLRADGVDAHPATGDLGSPASIAGLLECHERRFGRLDVLVVSAGSGRPGPLGDLHGADVARMLAVNVEGPALLVSAALAALRRAGAEHGRALVFVISSMAGRWPVPGFAAYSATKAALVSLARSVNVEAAEHGVRACALCPAYVDTAMAAWRTGAIPADTMLPVGDVAEAVRFVLRLSPNALVDDITIRRVGTGPLSP
jgi:NAD(P)-dependent dehydrogenase (short-subunit alcohol dehydrogenase family)